MEIIILIVAMVIVGLVMGFIAGLIWKDNRPIGVIVAVIFGLLDWFVIPAMGFSDTMKYIGILFEPALGALAVLWLIRVAKK